jgi:hypothetical protein
MYIDMVGYFAEERVARMTSLILVDKNYEYVIDIVLARAYIVNSWLPVLYGDGLGVEVLGLQRYGLVSICFGQLLRIT